jgi:hypothetical protein
MPLLSSKLLSNWYKLTIPGYNKVLAESFTQSKVQDASNKGMIQGDIGVRVMDVGALYYTSSISGPVIVSATSEFNDLFSLVSNVSDSQRQPKAGTDTLTTYLMKSAQLQVSTDSVRVTTNFEGDYPLTVASYNDSGLVDLTARTARFYDTYFYFGEFSYQNNGSLYSKFPIISGDININFDIDKNYFLSQRQNPYFSIRGYSASGNVKIALTPAQYLYLTTGYDTPLDDSDNFDIIQTIPAPMNGSYQNPGFLGYNLGSIGVAVADNGSFKNLNLGSAFVISKMEFSMQQNSIITATIEFNAFFNSSSDLTSFDPLPSL